MSHKYLLAYTVYLIAHPMNLFAMASSFQIRSTNTSLGTVGFMNGIETLNFVSYAMIKS